MCEAKVFRPCERDELMTLVKGLQRQIAQLQGQNAQLAAANERLSKQLAELQRAGKRQAAPFSKGRRDLQPQAAWAQAGSRDVQLPQAAVPRSGHRADRRGDRTWGHMFWMRRPTRA